MDPTFRLVDAVPSIEDYLRLRLVAGLTPKTVAGAGLGLPNSIVAVTVEREGGAVGMGRVIGDGGLFFQIVDIAVEPAHQGQGLGKAIMTRLMERLQAVAPSDAYVSLIADGSAHLLYARFGFTPTAPKSIGMHMKLP